MRQCFITTVCVHQSDVLYGNADKIELVDSELPLQKSIVVAHCKREQKQHFWVGWWGRKSGWRMHSSGAMELSAGTGNVSVQGAL